MKAGQGVVGVASRAVLWEVEWWRVERDGVGCGGGFARVAVDGRKWMEDAGYGVESMQRLLHGRWCLLA